MDCSANVEAVVEGRDSTDYQWKCEVVGARCGSGRGKEEEDRVEAAALYVGFDDGVEIESVCIVMGCCCQVISGE